MSNKKLDVLCVGAALVDIPLQPVSRDLFEIESLPLQHIGMTIGGDAINEATIISRLGKRTGLLSMVGKDLPGDYVIRHCDREGIEASGVMQKEGVDTSINIGMVTEDGERTFITNRNGSLWKETIEDLNLDHLEDADFLSFGSIFNNPLLDTPALVQIFSKAKELGLTICADMIKPRFNQTLEDIQDALAYVDYFFPNYDEACLVSGETELEKVADRFLQAGVKHVIIKIGIRGCYIRSKDGSSMIVPAMKGITAIDTIGAGDNFASGFITGLVEGLSLKECGEYANVTASISIQSVGATTGVKSRAQFEERLAEYKKQQEN